MAQPNEDQNPEDNSQDNPDTPATEPLNLEDVVSVPPAELDENQTKFLQENADSLTDEQKETYKEVLTPKDEKSEDEDIDIDKIEPETRGAKAKEKEDKSKKSDEGDEEDEEIDPGDEKAIRKVVKEETAGVSEALSQIQQLKDQNEVDALIRLVPEYAKYREVALKYMNHPAYSNIPAKNIMAMVTSKDMQKLGAQKEREAAKKAADTKGGAAQARTPTGGKVDYKNMPAPEFQKVKEEALRQVGR